MDNGLKIAVLSKKVTAMSKHLKMQDTQIANLKICIDALLSGNKKLVEEILLSPGSNDYHCGRPHPMTDSIFKDEHELWEHKKRT